jgi:signal transduction histidine kinase/ActR/RegA family two-component response regulator
VPTRVTQAAQLLKNARVVIIIGFGLVLAAVTGVAILVARSDRADRLVNHTFEVQGDYQSLMNNLRTAENAQRGFLLTENDPYLPPFEAAKARIPPLLGGLRQLTADNPNQQARLARLDPLIKSRIELMDRTIAMTKQGQRDQAVTLVDAGEGKALTEKIVGEVSQGLMVERDLLRFRQERSRQLRLGLSALIGLALFAAIVLAVILAASTRQALRGLVARTMELQTESKRRLEAEETLRQAQKMEAVGQLTGGIAHDFNNLLTIIIGNLDSMNRRLAKIDASASASDLAAGLMKPLEGALRGASSAAQLTHRLLAFSRRQALEPARVDLNRLVADMLDMLRRSLGEQINLETVLSAGLWPSFADPHQLENVLLNLALNARAAMPNGGCLTIETANTFLDGTYAGQFGDVDEGQYVLLSVTDTGTGIAKDIIDRVFDPFFTTKAVGEGSGLGLPMVHGIVKQSGGHIRIYSEEGHGTTVKVYLPRLNAADEVSVVPTAKPPDVAPVPKAEPNETILLVEDNDGVRDYATRVLEELGYHVIGTADAREALALLAKHPHIALLFTDVVLPGVVTGRMLADKAKAMRPALPVLFTTGYTRNAIVHQGRLDPDVHLLNKPYTQQDLARKVRSLLDAAQLDQRSRASV